MNAAFCSQLSSSRQRCQAIDELRAVYLELLNDGGYTDKPLAPRLVSEDTPIREETLTLLAAEERAIKARNKNKESFSASWSNLVARDDRLASRGKVDAKFAKENPLSENFKKWANENFKTIRTKLDTDSRLNVTYKNGSAQDMLNRELNRSMNEFAHEFHSPDMLNLRVFPIKYTPQPREERSFKEILASIDREIRQWNPRATLFTEGEIDEDSGEWIQEPEIIGDVPQPAERGHRRKRR